MSKIKNLLSVNEIEKIKIQKSFDKSRADIDQSLEILQEWLKKQRHLPYTLNNVELENFLVRNKFRIERTKTKIDAYFTLKSLHPKFFESDRIRPDSEAMKNVCKFIDIFFLPKLEEDGTRIMLFRVVEGSDPEFFNVKDVFSYSMILMEFVLSFDYSAKIRMVGDIQHLKLAHYLKIDLPTLSSAFYILQEGYSARIAGLHYINGPSFMDLLLKLLKVAVKPKIFGRITNSTDWNTFYSDFVGKEYFPEDFGGTLGISFEELKCSWKNELLLQKYWILEKGKMRSDESLRIGDCPYVNELFGTEGTFKLLNID